MLNPDALRELIRGRASLVLQALDADSGRRRTLHAQPQRRYEGRIKDLVVIRGRNLHPEDVEQVVERCHPALRPGSGAAFGVWEDEEERLALVHEIHPRYEGDLDEVVTAMRGAVSESHQVAVHAEQRLTHLTWSHCAQLLIDELATVVSP